MASEPAMLFDDADWLPGDPWRILETDPLGRHYYAGLTQFIRTYAIQSIVEIGIRCGHSMLAMLRANPELTYLGIDDDSGQWSGIDGGLAHADVLRQRYAKGQAVLWKVDSQTLTELPEHFDAAYIDGAHDEMSCRHDLELCRAWCTFLLVDDYTFLPGVHTAVDAFSRAYGIPIRFISSYRGWALLDTRHAGVLPRHAEGEPYLGGYLCLLQQPTFHPVVGLIKPGPVPILEEDRPVAEALVKAGVLHRAGDLDAG